MSTFRGTAQGERTETSRQGEWQMTTTCRGWRAGVDVKAIRAYSELSTETYTVTAMRGNRNPDRTRDIARVDLGRDGGARVTLYHPLTGAVLYAGALFKGEDD